MASLKWFAAVALTALTASFGRAQAADVKEINFVEAVHNVGYINLYVGQPSVAAAESQGAKIVFNFTKYVGPFCNTGIMVLPDHAKANPDVVLALVKSFEEAGRLVYSDPAYAKKVASGVPGHPRRSRG